MFHIDSFICQSWTYVEGAASYMCMVFLLLVQALLYQWSTAHGVDCQNNQYVDGCTTPFDLKMMFQDNFTPACNMHDICYSCAVSYGKNRADCDNMLKQNTFKVCTHFLDDIDKAACEAASFAYYEVADTFGETHFVNISPKWCKDDWVKLCLT